MVAPVFTCICPFALENCQEYSVPHSYPAKTIGVTLPYTTRVGGCAPRKSQLMSVMNSTVQSPHGQRQSQRLEGSMLWGWAGVQCPLAS